MNEENMRRDTTRQSISIETNPNKLYYCMKVILVIFKLIGLAPFSIAQRPSLGNVSKDNNSQCMSTVQFKYSRIGCLYTVFLTVSLFGICFVSIPLLYEEYYPFKSKLTLTIELAQTVCYNTVVLVLWSLLCAKQKTMVKTLDRLTNVDSTLVSWSCGSNPKSSWCFFLLLYLSSAIVCFVMTISVQICFEASAISVFNDCVPAVIINWFIIQYVSVVKLIENRFRALSHAFLNRSKPTIGQTISSSIQEQISIDQNNCPKIITLRRIHTILYEISYEVSEYYSLPILLTIAVTCFSIITNAYFVILTLVVSAKLTVVCTTFNATSGLLGLCLPIIMLTQAVNRTTAAMRKIADVTHKLLEKSSTSPEDKSQLQQFSVKLLQPTDDLFTAYGLFPLNKTLLHSIFSMVVTYLIILCQLQLSSTNKVYANSTYHSQ